MLMAGVRGLEPRSTVLETAVFILLDYTPIGAQRGIRTLKTTFLKRVRLPIASPELILSLNNHHQYYIGHF